jgi:hypothetical protein
MARCEAQTKSGEPCRIAALPGKNRCFRHDPDLADQRKQWHGQGGRNKRTFTRVARALPPSLQDLSDRLIRAMDMVESDTMAPGKALALAALSGRFIQLYEAGIAAADRSELQTDIDQLKEEVRNRAA